MQKQLLVVILNLTGPGRYQADKFDTSSEPTV